MAGLGSILVWLGFTGAVATVAWFLVLAASGDVLRQPLPRAAVPLGLLGSALVLTSLAAPWIRGPSADTGETLVLRGWSGLDPVTVLALVTVSVVVGVVVLVARTIRSDDRTPTGAATALLSLATVAAAGLIVGNLLIQANQPGGSRVVPLGFALALTGVALVGASAVVSRRSAR